MDAGCRRLTATWVRERAGAGAAGGGDASVELCDFFETYERAGADALLPPGVYTVRLLRCAAALACARLLTSRLRAALHSCTT